MVVLTKPLIDLTLLLIAFLNMLIDGSKLNALTAKANRSVPALSQHQY